MDKKILLQLKYIFQMKFTRVFSTSSEFKTEEVFEKQYVVSVSINVLTLKENTLDSSVGIELSLYTFAVQV